MIKVSIIVPVYNVSDFIIRCIDSVINQTYSDIECLLIDDASPDNSIALAKQRLESYHGSIDFKIICHDKNEGASVARNTGINNATGDYLYFLDSDDEITPDCIETLVNQLTNGEDMVIGSVKVLNSNMDLRVKLTTPLYTNAAVFDAYINYQWNVADWNKLIRKDCIIDNRLYFVPGLIYEDNLWSFQTATVLKSINYTLQETYIYHVRDNSLNTTLNQRNIDSCLFITEQLIIISKSLKQDVSAFLVDNSFTFAKWIYHALKNKSEFYHYTQLVAGQLKRYPVKRTRLNRIQQVIFVILAHPRLFYLYYSIRTVITTNKWTGKLYGKIMVNFISSQKKQVFLAEKHK
jgi:glycosyltransferase involved in cell wall biosynthesis